MTKKHYIAMARRFKEIRNQFNSNEGGPRFKAGLLTGLNTTVMALVEQLQIDNPAFDRAKFLEACGVSV